MVACHGINHGAKAGGERLGFYQRSQHVPGYAVFRCATPLTEENNRTLVLALSTQCHFCAESAPFFQRFQKEPAKNLKMIAVLPQAVEEARKCLEREGVQVDDVKQASLRTIGVRGTPTLLLVDSKGTVADVWQGKLDPDQEAGVLGVLKKDVP